MRIMEQAKNETTSVALETIITNAVKIPGVKVNRSKFLAEAFAGDGIDLQTIIDMGPVSAGIPQERIEKAATKLIFVRTSQSSVASFVAGIPGGFAMAATIPADVAQFFGMALRLAQEWLCVKLPCAIIVCCFGIVCCVLILLFPIGLRCFRCAWNILT